MKIISYLQKEHHLARRKITEMINSEFIFVNGKKIESYSYEIKDGDELCIHSSEFNFKGLCKIEEIKSDGNIILFNKPKGYVVSKSDPHNKTIYELLPKNFGKYYYIGRLDKDSHGLLLLTDDSKLVNVFEHPSNMIEKEYIVKIDRKINSLDKQKMLDGIEDEGDLLKFVNIKSIGEITYDIILTEGKKRHIRRVFKSLGYEVLDLQRIREGDFKLGDLKLGALRFTKD